MVYRKAVAEDVDGIEVIYDKVLTLEEEGRASIGWQRGVYPTRETARMAMRRDDLFVCEDEKTGRILATAIINHMQMDSYADVEWRVEATGDEVMVLHTLVVDPDASGRGIGSGFVKFYERYAKSEGCKDLRMDTQAKNHAARQLYKGLGYEEIGTTLCEFNGIPGITLVLLEKPLI